MKRSSIFIISFISLIALIFGLRAIFSASSPPNLSTPSPPSDKANQIAINLHLSDTLFDIPEAEMLDFQIERFLKQWEINGASLAIMKDEKLIYAKGYGWADKEKEEPVEVKHIFRIASVSKLITAAAIMKLCEEGKLSLTDKPFSKGGILNLPRFDTVITDRRMRNMTIEHLLRHQAGFSLGDGDPMFNILNITKRLGLDTVAKADDIIAYSLARRLGFAPGTGTKYSNLGYVILSRIIEVVSLQSYESYIEENILHPAGVYDIHIAKNFYEQRYDNEVRYYEPENSEPISAYDGRDTLLPRCYGGNDIEGLLGAGAWVASPGEILKFVAAIDGRGEIPDILSPESIKIMTTATPSMLPIGWAKCIQDNWARTGTLSGSSAVLKYNKDGYSWFFVTNTSSWNGSRFPAQIENLFRKSLPRISAWPQHNLFDIDSLINIASN
jgi:Beta-lactamase class C and other penicillin binding proteins